MEPLYKVAKELEPALSRPMKEVVRSQQVGMQRRDPLSMESHHGRCMVSAVQADVVLKRSPCWVQSLTTVKTD